MQYGDTLSQFPEHVLHVAFLLNKSENRLGPTALHESRISNLDSIILPFGLLLVWCANELLTADNSEIYHAQAVPHLRMALDLTTSHVLRNAFHCYIRVLRNVGRHASCQLPILEVEHTQRTTNQIVTSTIMVEMTENSCHVWGT